MHVLITDQKTGKNCRIGPIVLLGANYTPTKEEYFAEAWRIACEDGLVDPDNQPNYSFSFA